MRIRHNANHAREKQRRRLAVAQHKISQGCQYVEKTGNRCLFGKGDDIELAIGLQLDHRPGTHKVDDVSSLVSSKSSWEKIWAEVAKCDVLCANHHHIITERRRRDGTAWPAHGDTQQHQMKLWGVGHGWG
jgi:hypothetical protein